MHRRYNRFHSRFDQPDPYEGSYDPADPQSFNRYAYVQNDPVNFTDPSGLFRPGPGTRTGTRTGFIDSGQCYTLWVDGMVMGTVGNCGGGDTGDLDEGIREVIDPQNPARTDNACEVMTWLAQNIAESAIDEAKGDLNKALEIFDAEFSKKYLGYPLKTVSDGRALQKKGGLNQSTLDGYYRGGAGFKEDMKNGYPFYTNNQDQTHHYAAYQSAAINGLLLGSIGHQVFDAMQANAGDSRLGGAAMVIGRALRKDPSGLRTIGETIFNAVCEPK